MRLRSSIVLAFGLVLAACIDHPDPPSVGDETKQFPADDAKPGGGSTTASTTTGTKPGTTSAQTPAKDPKTVLTEVVYVLMDGYDGNDYLCTGTLISKDTVVTAGHCLDENNFENWRVVAPLAKGQPRVSASQPNIRSWDWETVENPDIGFLKLDEPIELDAYGVLTNVSDRVDKGEKLQAVAIVRTEPEVEAPFKAVGDLHVQSTTEVGYMHGIGTQLFSHGGDSGAGLFLVENGAPTHKLIGVLREPDPETETDHFTRIDGDFTSWLAENTGE